MAVVTKRIECKGETLLLTNQRAVFWPQNDMLILSDLHIGKTAHFRKSGVPISSNVLQKDLERLKTIIAYFRPKTILITGDLFHAEFNTDVMVFKTWMQQFKHINLILVKGNHDKHSFELYESLNIEILPHSLKKGPFVFTHNIKTLVDGEFYISGHTHPGVLIKGKGKQRIKLPCYQVTHQQLILPAFSLFTGLNTNIPSNLCANYAFTDLSVFKV
ncbi:ligase-associated DNA damage response endonuclease PdeM [Jejuia pallidilutea]|uniref:ICC-like protein phosphoesterase n=1 Tax=Jejuia pallidilutea TaxID=504487 RepID=A0A090W525_9FLAO|nr:ligase-associated DNA damage response endonuclease PdeM [Jejuia pallidilutea]GAL68825.1 ICC-like protein phosphoesterase [Jejuia pallidilutea]GAL72125.1 ICC-like protein phosphoesterase [Jejuia pallidilutea]GAL90724.1 ICC-like protein phosphoesterase [Jejuia pallidilutea]